METMKVTMVTTMGTSTALTHNNPDINSELIHLAQEFPTQCFLCIFVSTFSLLKSVCIINI